MTIGAGGGRFGVGISRARSNSQGLCGARSRLSSFDAMERMCPAGRPLTRSIPKSRSSPWICRASGVHRWEPVPTFGERCVIQICLVHLDRHTADDY
jgi:hypothetical protein